MANKEKVNPAQCEVMAKLVDDLTTTGKPILDEKQMKAFKKICKYERQKFQRRTLSNFLHIRQDRFRFSSFLFQAVRRVRKTCLPPADNTAGEETL